MTDWQRLETEYVTTQKSYADLAKEFKVPRTSICVRGKADRWVEKRQKHQADVMAKTLQKTAEKISEDQSDLAASLNQSALRFAQRVYDKLTAPGDIKPMDLLRLAQVWQILHDSIEKGTEVDEDMVGGLCMMPGRTEMDDA